MKLGQKLVNVPFKNSHTGGDLQIRVVVLQVGEDGDAQLVPHHLGKELLVADDQCPVHHIGGLPDFSALKFTKYNQYESLILPMVKYLEAAGVTFEYGIQVTNVLFKKEGAKKIASEIV